MLPGGIVIVEEKGQEPMLAFGSRPLFCEERTRHSLGMERPPARRLAEVSDIAETIINALLPDDEDDCRDLIDDDYQLQSDIETFEQLTGKVIQPEDDVSIVGDEIELEDIERSLS